MSTNPAPSGAPGAAAADPGDAVVAAPGAGPGAGTAVALSPKPLLRGAIHALVAPFVLIASIVLVALSPTPAVRWANVVFGVSAVLLFGTSAVYHRGHWSPRVAAVLRRLDHTNIFLIIAGTYTPLSVLLLPASTARTLLIVVWTGALLGVLFRVFWLDAPRWSYVPIYVALGWVAVGFMPQFWRAPNGPTIVWLIAIGGLAYTVGAVVYGVRRPNPLPRWFGFHEVFHGLTVVGYTCHLVAVWIATTALS